MINKEMITETIRKQKGTLATAATGAIIGSLITGAILSSTIDGKIRAYIDETLGKSYPFSVTIDIYNNDKPINLPQSFAEVEEIVGDTKERSWLAKRIGFVYESDDTVPESLRSFQGWYLDRGTITKYAVEEPSLLASHVSDAQERMSISSYYGDSGASSTISVQDWNRDGRLDWISVTDDVNNTGFFISREYDYASESLTDKMIAKGINEKGAADFINYFTARFHQFKKDHNIEAKLREFQPNMVIHESYPGKINSE